MSKVLTEETKKCSMCCSIRSKDDFGKCTGSPDGLQPRCRDCNSKYSKWRELHPESEYSGKGTYQYGVCEATFFFRKDVLGWDIDRFEEEFHSDLEIPMKYCGRCERDLPFDNFNLSKNSKDGHQPYCRECTKEINAEQRAKKRLQNVKSVVKSYINLTGVEDNHSNDVHDVHDDISDIIVLKDHLLSLGMTYSVFLKVMKVIESDLYKETVDIYNNLSPSNKDLIDRLFKNN